MKIYNPFSWHVVQFAGGGYAVRRLSYLLVFWVFADKTGDGYKWTEARHIGEWCLMKDKESAVNLAQVLRLSAKVVWP